MAGYPAPGEMASLLDSLKDELHPRAREIVRGLLDVGEHRLAIEHLCELVGEDEITLDATAYRRLMAVASGLGLDERYTRIVPVPPGFAPDVK